MSLSVKSVGMGVITWFIGEKAYSTCESVKMLSEAFWAWIMSQHSPNIHIEVFDTSIWANWVHMERPQCHYSTPLPNKLWWRGMLKAWRSLQPRENTPNTVRRSLTSPYISSLQWERAEIMPIRLLLIFNTVNTEPSAQTEGKMRKATRWKHIPVIW